MKKYTVKKAMVHNGKHYQRGDVIELKEDQHAKTLLARGYIAGIAVIKASVSTAPTEQTPVKNKKTATSEQEANNG